MPHAYTEDQLVEQPAIGLFAELGWETVSAQVSLSLRSLVLMVTAVMIIFMLLTTVELVTAPAQRQCYISITQGQRHIKILRYADLLAYYA
jgi:hypothetical protein